MKGEVYQPEPMYRVTLALEEAQGLRRELISATSRAHAAGESMPGISLLNWVLADAGVRL